MELNKTQPNQPTTDNDNINQQNYLHNQNQAIDAAFFHSIIISIIINRQLPMLMNNESTKKVASSIILLCKTVQQIFLQEDSLLDLESPIKVCGDIHGQLNDLIKILNTGGFENDDKYLFLGDYIDRGPNSLEVICLLFALKCMYPYKIFLIRGNHESPEMAESFGFAEEIEKKLGKNEDSDLVINTFYDVFDCLPIAALINDDIFCVHGGLSPELDRIEDLLGIKRPIEVPEKGIIADLLWSDPDTRISSWGPNERGVTFSWGKKVSDEFITKNKLSVIIRAHQMAHKGIDFPFYPDKRVITVFSASNYSSNNNSGAFIDIKDEPPTINFTILKNDFIKKDDSEKIDPKADKENRNENINANLFDDNVKINGNASHPNQNTDLKNTVLYK